MKKKMTRKAIKEEFGLKNIYSLGSCQVQGLLNNSSPFAYSTRAEGWACDYYEFKIGDRYIVISTGYAPIGKSVDYKLTKKYENQVNTINYSLERKGKEEKLQELLNNYLKDIIKKNLKQ